MAEELLGLEFAIHGGGSDLVFPHHENEIAQTEAARGRPLARIWMHNGMVQAGSRREDVEVARQHLPARRGDRRLRRRGRGRLPRLRPLPPADRLRRRGAARRRRPRNERIREFFREAAARTPAGERAPAVAARREAFLDALADDFNTPRALAELFSLIAEARREPLPGRHARGRARCSRCSGSSRSPPTTEDGRPASEAEELLARARAGPRRARLRARRRDPRPRSPSSASRCATRPAAPGSSPRRLRPVAAARRRLRPQPGARGAARPAPRAPGLDAPRTPTPPS